MKVISKSKSNSTKEKKKTELVTRQEIEGSPFIIIGTEEDDKRRKYFGTMGKYRITEPSYNEDEIKEDLEKITWNRIIQVILLINETTK